MNAPLQNAPPPTPIAARFCADCGAPIDPVQASCNECLARVARASTQPLRDDGGQRSTRGALYLYFSMLAMCIGGGIAQLCGASELHVNVGVSAALTFVVIVGAMVSWRGVVPLFRRVPNVLWFLAAIGISFVTLGIALGVIHGYQRAIGGPGEKMSDPFIKAGYGWGIVVLFWCVQPAIFEELAFRGTIMGALSRALSPLETVGVSALMFMILHLSPARFPHTLALGIGTGYLRLRTRSLYPGILLHFCHNFAAVAIEWAT